MGSSSKSGDGEVELLVQLFQVMAHHVPHLDILEMVPAAFFPRVEIGGNDFTMSLFIAGLALDGALLDEARVGILACSAVDALLGCLLLTVALRSKPDE